MLPFFKSLTKRQKTILWSIFLLGIAFFTHALDSFVRLEPLGNVSSHDSSIEEETKEVVLDKEDDVAEEEDEIIEPATVFGVLVTRVVDGDTIVIEEHNTEQKVRLIGVDAPESVDPRKKVECFGKEASAHLKERLEGKRVRLELDQTQDNQDRYGRLLRYVYLPDGTLVNKEIISDGYAHEYTYRVPYLFQAEFKAAVKTARTEERGLWAKNACPTP